MMFVLGMLAGIVVSRFLRWLAEISDDDDDDYDPSTDYSECGYR